ncbi:MAG TPA: sensor histidine kinase [Rhizomicrobium sp.]
MERTTKDVRDVRAQLVASAHMASTPAQNVLAAAEQVARTVANLPSVRNVAAQCSQTLAAAQHGLVYFTNISRLDARGRIVCAASPRSVGLMVRDPRAWTQMATRHDFVVGSSSISRVTHRQVVLALLPLHNAAGVFEGGIGIVIDVRWLDSMVRANTLPSDSVVALFDRAGTILASNRPGVALDLFHRHPDAAAATPRQAEDRFGHTWMFAIHPLLGNNVFVGFARRQSNLFGTTYIHVGTDILLPFLMIVLAWLAIWAVTERQLTRWIVYLRRLSGAYRAGHYAHKPALAGAPSEIRILGDALSEMASSIQDRDTSLREAVGQKTVLIKEIHHRVKNNLQIVMSLLSLQAARLTDPAAKEALAQARVRINALALVHRILYEIEDQQSVDVKRLLELLAEQTNEGFGGDRRDIHTRVNAMPLRVPGDVAVPIALFTVEALTNAYRHAYPPGTGGTIRVILAAAGDSRLRLSVEDDGVGIETAPGDASIGVRLIATFGQQLGGGVSVHPNGECGTIAELIFPAPKPAPPADDNGGGIRP